MAKLPFVVAAGLTAVSCGSEPGTGTTSSRPLVSAAPEPIKVAAASDLARAFEEVGAAYERETGNPVVFTFGSTGVFAKQLHEGAPFDVFAAANVGFVDEVVKSGHCLADTKSIYARGRIVLFARPGGPVPSRVGDLVDVRFKKVAIANPEHAPYGAAAKQALERAGVWDRVKDRLVFGENVLQTKQFADSGNADVAIVALSLAIGGDAPYVEVPAEQHDPLDQALVVCANEERGSAARDFAQWVGRGEGRRIMQKYGFVPPGESRGPVDAGKAP